MRHDLSGWQAEFSASLLDPGLPAPGNLIGPSGKPAGNRFSIYRNNIAVSLVDALQAGFPVVAKLVGEDFFRAMAREYIRSEIPRTPVLLEYGRGFPDFIAAFTPAQQIPYLADVARAELCWTESYHARDAMSLLSLEGADISEESIGLSRCILHPSMRLLSSEYPVGAIWAGHQGEQCSPPEEWNSERIMFLRPEGEVHLHFLDSGEFRFVERLAGCDTVEDAALAAISDFSGFDPGAALVKLLKIGALTEFTFIEQNESKKQ